MLGHLGVGLQFHRETAVSEDAKAARALGSGKVSRDHRLPDDPAGGNPGRSFRRIMVRGRARSYS